MIVFMISNTSDIWHRLIPWNLYSFKNDIVRPQNLWLSSEARNPLTLELWKRKKERRQSILYLNCSFFHHFHLFSVVIWTNCSCFPSLATALLPCLLALPVSLGQSLLVIRGCKTAHGHTQYKQREATSKKVALTHADTHRHKAFSMCISNRQCAILWCIRGLCIVMYSRSISVKVDGWWRCFSCHCGCVVDFGTTETEAVGTKTQILMRTGK